MTKCKQPKTNNNSNNAATYKCPYLVIANVKYIAKSPFDCNAIFTLTNSCVKSISKSKECFPLNCSSVFTTHESGDPERDKYSSPSNMTPRYYLWGVI